MQPDNVLMWVATVYWYFCRYKPQQDMGLNVTCVVFSDGLIYMWHYADASAPTTVLSSLYISHDHPRWQFRRRRLFRRRPHFFLCCWCVHMCTWCTETHSKRFMLPERLGRFISVIGLHTATRGRVCLLCILSTIEICMLCI